MTVTLIERLRGWRGSVGYAIIDEAANELEAMKHDIDRNFEISTELATENERLREALEAVQWAGRDNFKCIECEGQPSTGHTKQCRVGLALSKARGETPNG